MIRRLGVARLAAIGVGALLIARGGTCAASVLGPRRNVYGNPAFEERLAECRVPGSDAVARLYRGNAGATVAFWYSVTVEHRGGPERQFWYSYSSPWVDTIACRPGTVVLHARDSTGRVTTPAFALADIDSALVPRPFVYSYDSLARVSRAELHARGEDRPNPFTLAFSAILLVCGGALLLWGALSRRPVTLEARYLFARDLSADVSRRLLARLLALGADEFSVAVMAVQGEPAPTADAFEDALAPFALAPGPRPVPAADADVGRAVRRWKLTPASLRALLPFLPGGIFEYRVGPDGWLEDLTLYRRGELVLGVLSRQGEAVLRLSASEHAELRALGVESSEAGEWIAL